MGRWFSTLIADASNNTKTPLTPSRYSLLPSWVDVLQPLLGGMVSNKFWHRQQIAKNMSNKQIHTKKYFW